MSRSYALLSALAILSAPATAFADCPSTLVLQKRIDCLNTALNAAATTITALQTTNTELEASNAELEASNAELEASNVELVGRVDALEDDVANISADYLVSGDLDDYATLDYVDSLVAGFTDGIPNLSDYVSVDAATDSIVFTGANVYVQSGSGATDGAVNGLGNLIVGYDEDGTAFGELASDRTGSHNLVVGAGHTYSSYGSFVAGLLNAATGAFSSVSGGERNEASAWSSSVSGGGYNVASGDGSSVSAGYDDEASEAFATVSGGAYNIASGWASAVSGGGANEASGGLSSVSGGDSNIAAGDESSILGGAQITVSSQFGHSP